MKRRELIKLGSAILGGASIGTIAGYGLKSSIDGGNGEQATDGKLSIIPKQTAPYEYSSPMPFDKKLIDEIVELNNKMTKGKITTLYSSLPNPLGKSIHPLFASLRGDNNNIKTINDYLSYVKYAIEKGFKCVYILNTTIPVHKGDESIPKILDKVFKQLYEAGIRDVKIANVNLLVIFQTLFPVFNLHLSTTAEYHSIQNYQHVLNIYPQIKTINISTDDNHNFEFLNSAKKLFPDVKFEILVNESSCVKNCIARYYHECTDPVAFPCQQIIGKNPSLHIARNNLVYPWQLEYYSAIGINSFKFTCAPFARNLITNINYLKYYLTCVEEGADKFTANDLLDKIFYGIRVPMEFRFKKNYPLAKFIKEYLPDTNHFVENGAKCFSDCGTKCRYCYKFADKLKEFASKA